MTFTAEQRQVIETTGIVPITIDGIECVVVRADLYERMKGIFEYDDSEPDPREWYPLVLKVLDEEGSPQDAKDYLP